MLYFIFNFFLILSNFASFFIFFFRRSYCIEKNYARLIGGYECDLLSLFLWKLVRVHSLFLPICTEAQVGICVLSNHISCPSY